MLTQQLTEIQQKIIDLLFYNPKGMCRNEICEVFGFEKYEYVFHNRQWKKYPKCTYNRRTTIYDNLYKLRKMGLIEKFLQKNGKRGRPIVMWRLV